MTITILHVYIHEANFKVYVRLYGYVYVFLFVYTEHVQFSLKFLNH